MGMMRPIWVVLACLWLAFDGAPASGSSSRTNNNQILRAYCMLEQDTESAELLDEVQKGGYRYSEFVEHNLNNLISKHEQFEVLGVERDGPDVDGYLTYTVTYRPTVRQVLSLFYTVKEASQEALLLYNNEFLQDSLLDIFPGARSKDKFTVVNITLFMCWPRKETDDTGFLFCTFKLLFLNPELNTDEVKVIDMKKTYTTEHESEYSGTYFQINGEGALDQNELTPLESGKMSEVCTFSLGGDHLVPGLVSAHVYNTTGAMIAEIFGGSPSHYDTRLEYVVCGGTSCIMDIVWGEATDAYIHKFAIKKSIARANVDLHQLSSKFFGDRWTLNKIRHKEKKEKKKKAKGIKKSSSGSGR